MKEKIIMSKEEKDSGSTTITMSKDVVEKMKIICARRKQTYQELLKPFIDKEYKIAIANLPE
jgi:hypothetical protein